MFEIPQPRRLPRQQRSQALFDAILEASAQVLVERGYAGTNTNLIAEQAGVSVGSLYQYFPNKEALVAALHERHAENVESVIITALETTTTLDLSERLTVIVQGWIDLHQQTQALHRILEKEFPLFDAPTEQSPADQRIYQQIHQFLTQHCTSANKDLHLATWMLLGTLEALTYAAILPSRAPHDLAQIKQNLVTMLSRYLA